MSFEKVSPPVSNYQNYVEIESPEKVHNSTTEKVSKVASKFDWALFVGISMMVGGLAVTGTGIGVANPILAAAGAVITVAGVVYTCILMIIRLIARKSSSKDLHPSVNPDLSPFKHKPQANFARNNDKSVNKNDKPEQAELVQSKQEEQKVQIIDDEPIKSVLPMPSVDVHVMDMPAEPSPTAIVEELVVSAPDIKIEEGREEVVVEEVLQGELPKIIQKDEIKNLKKNPHNVTTQQLHDKFAAIKKVVEAKRGKEEPKVELTAEQKRIRELNEMQCFLREAVADLDRNKANPLGEPSEEARKLELFNEANVHYANARKVLLEKTGLDKEVSDDDLLKAAKALEAKLASEA